MVMTDPIADMLTRIRNASGDKTLVEVPHSRIKQAILRVLKEEGYIKDFEEVLRENKKFIQIHLFSARDGKKVISDLKKISKPSLRIYVGRGEIPEVLNGYGLAILTTSKGILSSREAKKMGIGGEVICYIW